LSGVRTYDYSIPQIPGTPGQQMKVMGKDFVATTGGWVPTSGLTPDQIKNLNTPTIPQNFNFKTGTLNPDLNNGIPWVITVDKNRNINGEGILPGGSKLPEVNFPPQVSKPESFGGVMPTPPVKLDPIGGIIATPPVKLDPIGGKLPVFDRLSRDSNGGIIFAEKTVQDLIVGSKPGPKTSGPTNQYIRPPEGFVGANADFDALGLDGIKPAGDGKRIGTLPDGRTVIVRPNSSKKNGVDGMATLEVQPLKGVSNREAEKFRYPSPILKEYKKPEAVSQDTFVNILAWLYSFMY